MTYCLLPLTKKSFNSDHKIDSIIDMYKRIPDVKKKGLDVGFTVNGSFEMGLDPIYVSFCQS